MLRTTTLTLLLLIPLTAAASPGTEEAWRQLAFARQELGQGQWQRALRSAESARALDPDNRHARALEATAVTLAGLAAPEIPEHLQLHYEATLALARGRCAEARDVAQRWRAEQPTDPDAWRLSGYADACLGDPPRALQRLEHAQQLGATDASLQRDLDALRAQAWSAPPQPVEVTPPQQPHLAAPRALSLSLGLGGASVAALGWIAAAEQGRRARLALRDAAAWEASGATPPPQQVALYRQAQQQQRALGVVSAIAALASSVSFVITWAEPPNRAEKVSHILLDSSDAHLPNPPPGSQQPDLDGSRDDRAAPR